MQPHPIPRSALGAFLYPAPEDPATLRLPAQEAAWASWRPFPVYPQTFSPLAALLFVAPTEDPPLRSTAQALAWGAYRYPRILGRGVGLSPALYPPPEDPPLRGRAQERFWEAYRAPIVRAQRILLAATLLPEAGGGEFGDCCEEVLAELSAIQSALAAQSIQLESIEDRLTALESGGTSVTTIIDNSVANQQQLVEGMDKILKLLRTILSDQEMGFRKTQKKDKK